MIVKLRSYSFWFIDILKGRVIKKHYQDIKSIIENYNLPAYQDKRNEYLKRILTHTVETTPFYQTLHGPIELQDFPVINKNLIRENFDSFKSKTFLQKPVLKMVTSGSTGTPFTVIQDLNKKARNYADTIWFAKMAGYNLGEKLYYFKIWHGNNRKTKWQSWKQNWRAIDVLKMDDEKIENLISELENDKAPKGFLGYASAFEAITRYIERNGKVPVKCKVNSAITISESLNPETKIAMKDIFNVSMVSRYSNIENGILAQQCTNGSEEFHLNIASYFFEILQIDMDKPVQTGEIGRIVVTDLFNYAMPLIRYDTGDIGSISDISQCSIKTPVLKHLEGRMLDLIYDTSGNLISSFLVYKNMWKYTEILQYQLIQEAKSEYTMKINIKFHFKRESELISELHEYLGSDAIITFEYVDEIPLLASGKRKKVASNYKKELYLS